jgi:FixJ family two-component response regulator
VSNSALISIVDDDGCMREAMRGLVRSLGFRAEAFDSAEAFLRCDHREETRCLILVTGFNIPIIFVTAHGGNGTRQEALDAGAVDFLPKPFSEDALFQAVHSVVGDESNEEETS